MNLINTSDVASDFFPYANHAKEEQQYACIYHSQTIPLTKMTTSRLSEKVQVDEILLRQKTEIQKNFAAIKIQSIWRCYSIQVKAQKAKKHLLSYALLEKAKPYVDIKLNRQDLPRASSGNTLVYLPKELPIVLKASGFPENHKRFHQMKQARDICEKSGYQNLVIPKARVYANFIIESRLPINMHGTKEQIGLYIENRARFADAVKEFTGFLCQSNFYDITGAIDDPYETLSKRPVGRYDNIVLYLEEDKGKIGLIDLERFSPGCSKSEKDWCFIKCLDAIHLFPYHVDEIISVAKKFDFNIEAYQKDLEQERDEVLKFFKIAYEDHLDFVRKKNITLENPIVFEKLSLIRSEKLKKVIEIELRKENDGVLFSGCLWFKGCLGEKPDETLICFNEKAFPIILDATYKLINDLLKFNMESQQSEAAISSNAQLLSLRTLKFGYRYSENNDFINSTTKSIEMLSFRSQHTVPVFLSFLLDVILKEFENGKEIAYYNPSFGYGGYATKCIFC